MKVGTIVECVNDIFDAERIKHIPNRPSRGNFYTVREVQEICSGHIGIKLDELHNPPLNGKEPTFKSERFREVVGLDEAVENLIEESMFVL